MHQDQSHSNLCDLKDQRKPLQSLDNTQNMQFLAKRIINNLVSSNVVNKVLPITTAALNNAHALASQPIAVRAYAEQKQKLLKFPAFPLKETIEKFLKSTEPLLTPQEQKDAIAYTNDFVVQHGNDLQALLEKEAAKSDNWLAHRWLRLAYLQYRDPVTVYSSPGMTFPLREFKTDDDYINFTATVIFGLLKYKQLIDTDKIPVVKMGKFELDNSQFGRVFGTCRVPGPKEDCLEFHPKSKHIVVINKNRFYYFPVYDKNDKPIHPTEIAKGLKLIYECNKAREKGPEIGLLSTDNRNNWAASYEELTKDKNSCLAVQDILRSLFTVSMDEFVEFKKCGEWNVQSHQLIHGGGVELNSANRWMDKTIQVIVNRNGLCGFCYEHSPAEGQPIALMIDFLQEHYLCNNNIEGAGDKPIGAVEELPLKVTECLNMYIQQAKRNITKLTTDLEIDVVHFQDYGKNFLKKQKLSPDSYVQMAIQLAFYNLHGVPAAQYESAHLRIYYGGRTETIRSCSTESVCFAQAMNDDKLNAVQKADSLRKAVTGHRKFTNWALEGRGVDRHLVGLKLMAIENGIPVPAFFNSLAFKKSAHFRVSTSQVASKYQAFMSYGPLTDDGYGCCYNPRNDDIILAVSAWHRDSTTSAVKFGNSLRRALKDMADVLKAAGPTPDSKPKAKL